MSSMLSSSPIDDPGYDAALVDVAEQSFFAFAELSDAGSLTDEIAAEPAWLRAHMTFVSDAQKGMMTVVLPSTLAADLSSAFSGEDPGALHVWMVADLTGEFCNMVCGLWLTRACPTERFRLHPPEVTVLRRPPEGPGWTAARINGVPVLVVASRQPS